MTKRIAAESEVRHGQTYWQIVDYDEECVIAELGCSPDSEVWAEEIVKRWDTYRQPIKPRPGDVAAPLIEFVASGRMLKESEIVAIIQAIRAGEEARGK